MGDKKTWDFDEYPWVDDAYDDRMRGLVRLCYDETLPALPALAQAEPGALVLDIGTGTGNSALPFLERGCRVVGVDPSLRMLKQAQAKVLAWAGRFSVLLVADPFLSLPFRPGSFDVIASAYAIHHLDERGKALAVRAMNSALRPGGTLVIADTMFRDEDHKAEALRADRSLEDEYQPLLGSFPATFEREGFGVGLHQVGELVWVLIARRDT